VRATSEFQFRHLWIFNASPLEDSPLCSPPAPRTMTTNVEDDPRYYAANVFVPDGNSLEAVYKSWQHRQS